MGVFRWPGPCCLVVPPLLPDQLAAHAWAENLQRRAQRARQRLARLLTLRRGYNNFHHIARTTPQTASAGGTGSRSAHPIRCPGSCDPQAEAHRPTSPFSARAWRCSSAASRPHRAHKMCCSSRPRALKRAWPRVRAVRRNGREWWRSRTPGTEDRKVRPALGGADFRAGRAPLQKAHEHRRMQLLGASSHDAGPRQESDVETTPGPTVAGRGGRLQCARWPLVAAAAARRGM